MGQQANLNLKTSQKTREVLVFQEQAFKYCKII